MNLKKIAGAAGALLLAPIVLFSGCTSTPTLTLSANWYANTNNFGGLTGTSEQLSYSVTFKEEDENADYRVNFDEGTYTTSLTSMNISYAEGNPIGYYYETQYEITGRYFHKGEKGADFTDTITSKIWFLGIADGLRPIRSEKTVTCHAPRAVVTDPAEMSTLYRYSYVAEYNTDMSSTTITYTNLEAQETKPAETVLKLKKGGTFLDNEQILFALRGLDMTSTFSFATVNPVKRQTATVHSSEAPTVSQFTSNFSMKTGDGEAVKESRTFDAMTVSISYGGSNGGRDQKLVYAKCVNPDANTYRNVLLHMETYGLSNLGTFSYDLQQAAFCNK